MNPIDPNLKTGTLGELLVQLRLLQYDVQAAPPLKDSGNDLIAVKGSVIRAIQVKTTTKETFKRARPKKYHLAALVALRGEGRELRLDESQIFLVPRGYDSYTKPEELAKWKLSADLVESLFRPCCS